MTTFNFSHVPNIAEFTAKPRPKVTARWKLPDLLTALASSGWGPLAGYEWQGLRSTLYAVTARVNHITGEGAATAYQIADAAGLSDRWTRECLNRLEELGLLEWHRGFVFEERRRASFFRVNKKALAQLIRDARDEMTARVAKRTADFVKRLMKLKKITVFQGKTKVEPELSSSHSTLTGEVFQPASPGWKKNLTPGDRTMIQRPVPRPKKWVDFCKHSESKDPSIIHSCPDCRFDSLTPEEYAEYEGELYRAELDAKKYQSATANTPELQALEMFMSHHYPGLSPAKRAVAYAKDLRTGRVPSFNDWYARQSLFEVKA